MVHTCNSGLGLGLFNLEYTSVLKVGKGTLRTFENMKRPVTRTT